LLAALHNELGDLYAAEMRFDNSDAAYESAIVAAQTIAPTDNESQLQLARAHVALGDLPPQRRRMEGSADGQIQVQRDHLSIASELLESLHEAIAHNSDVETLRARVQLAQSRIETSPAQKHAGFQTAVDILRDQLTMTPDDAVVRFTLVETLASVNLRREIRTRFQRRNVTSRLEASLNELQPLRSRFPDTPVFAVSEVHIRHKLFSLARSSGEIAEAMEQLEKAITIQSAVVEASPQDFSHRCWRALLYRSQAELCQLKGDDQCEQDAIANAINDLAAIDSSESEHPFVKQTRQIIQELEVRATDVNETIPHRP
jgi:tetratricopeptide (TPR) repeat protein